MISVNLSLDQLIDTIRSLNEAEKQKIRSILSDENIEIADEQKEEILRRESEYKSGRMKTYTLEEVKSSFNFRD